MARRLTDTYFVECSFSIRFETTSQIISTKKSIGVWVIPKNEELSEYIQTVVERQVKCDFGDNYKIAEFLITKITPL